MKIADVIASRDCRELAKLVEHKIDKDGSIWIKHKKSEHWHVRVSNKCYYDFDHDIRGNYKDLLAWLLTEANHGSIFASRIYEMIVAAQVDLEIKETELSFKLKGKINMMFDGMNNN